MKKKIIAAMLMSAMLMTACNSNGNVETTTTQTEVTTTTTEATTTTETTTEASTVPTYDDRMLKMSNEEIAEALRKESGMVRFVDYDEMTGDRWEKNAALGIKSVTQSGFSADWEKESKGYLYVFIIFEMDMDSDVYKNLKVGSKLDNYIWNSYNNEYINNVQTVSAINKQYVLTCNEVYFNKDGSQKFNEKAPFHFKVLDKVIKSFKALKTE